MGKLLGTLLFVFAAGAQAQTTLNLTGLSAQFETTVPASVSVLADTGSYAQLGFPLLESRADIHSYDLYTEDITEFYLTPRPGYVIDGLRFTAQLRGALDQDTAIPAGAGDVFPAHATNGARIALYAVAFDGQPPRNLLLTTQDLDGEQAIDFDMLSLHTGAPIGLSLYDMLSARVEYGAYTLNGVEYRLDATAEIQLTNPILTIHLAPLPVPEPHSWALLAAGLLWLRVRRTI